MQLLQIGNHLPRTIRLIGIAGLLFSFLLVPAMPAAAIDLPGARCFDETGFCISGRMAEFWEEHGGLPIFGFPISPLLTTTVEGRQRQVQWFERTRLELAPENQRPFDVLLGRMGAEALKSTGSDPQNQPRETARDECRFFSETGQNVCGAFLAAWQAQGLEFDGQAGASAAESLALFGLPLGPPQPSQREDGTLINVQWFERARFEQHPDQPQILFGLLGNTLRRSDPGSITAQFVVGPCPFRSDLRVDCGTLIVPQDRSRPNERSVALTVAIFRSPNPAPDPVVYLSGGPGGGAIENAPGLARAWRGFWAGRDMIFFDQRGTGTSWPALRCPEISEFAASVRNRTLSGPEWVRGEADALLRCRDRFAQKEVRMAAYNSATSVADLEDLRRALGYERWNLFGVSYGTRLALTAMRDTPNSLRSVVLDSVYPLQSNLYTEMPANVNRALSTLFTGCATNRACNESYPELEQTFYRLVDELNASPIPIEVDGQISQLSGDRLIGSMFRLLYSSALIPRLPQAISALSTGDSSILGTLISERSGGAGLAQALYYAVQCNEELAFNTQEDLNNAVNRYPKLAGFFSGVLETSGVSSELCAGYRTNSPDPRENQPVFSRIPTLLLVGEYDPITPPEWGEVAANGLSVSYTYAFPGTGHAVVGRGACPVGMIRNFLAAPERAPDASCIAGFSGPNFVVNR
jgi:pimeloyl-ACP methyl ester carboxylesterase